MDALTKISRAVSALFHPLLIPAYGMVMAIQFSELYVLPFRTKLVSTVVVFVLTGLLPMIIISGMSRLNLIKDISLNDRSDRGLPYASSLALYVMTIFYLYLVNAPWWIAAFMCGGSLALLIVLIVNKWWKISAHATALGGMTALALSIACHFPGDESRVWILIAVLMAAGMVGTARLILQRHTPAQVYAGYANGLICVMLMSNI